MEGIWSQSVDAIQWAVKGDECRFSERSENTDRTFVPLLGLYHQRLNIPARHHVYSTLGFDFIQTRLHDAETMVQKHRVRARHGQYHRRNCHFLGWPVILHASQ